MEANAVSGRTWRDILAKDRPWQDRSADVERILRATLAGLTDSDVLTTRELVEWIFPIASIADGADEGARHELVNRILKLAENVPGLAVCAPEAMKTGPHKGRTVRRWLWRRLDPAAARTSPAVALADPEIAALQSRIAACESGLADLGARIAAFAAKVGG